MALLLLASPIYPEQDTYTPYLREFAKFARIWNPDLTAEQIGVLGWTGFDGCGRNMEAAVWYACVRSEETGWRLLDTDNVFGYSGAYWWTLIIHAQRQGAQRPKIGWRRYYRKHPYQADRILAKAFLGFYDSLGAEEACKTWHRGAKRYRNKTQEQDADEYWEKMKIIRARWKDENLR